MASQDRFSLLGARIPTITASELVLELQRALNITVGQDTVRNRLNEANLYTSRPI